MACAKGDIVDDENPTPKSGGSATANRCTDGGVLEEVCTVTRLPVDVCQIAVNLMRNLRVGSAALAKASKHSKCSHVCTSGKPGEEGFGPGEYNTPLGVAVDPIRGMVLVADFHNHRIQVLDARDLAFRGLFGSKGERDGQFKYPWAVAVTSQGLVVVADSGNNRVQVFAPSDRSHEYRFLRQFGSQHLKGLCGVAVDSADRIIVSTGSEAVCVFTLDGALVTRIGTLGSEGSDNGEFIIPSGVAVNSRDEIVVVDQGNNRVQVFDREGRFLRKFGCKGSGDGRLDCPFGVAVWGDQNHVVVADQFNYRLSVFDDKGQFVFSYGSEGAGADQFKHCSGVGVLPNGDLVVSSSHMVRVLRFTP